ncbi:hypothetical protein CNS12_06835, partial [Campylobacter jejuni]|nr:hypothetical protein [Campylobacter jejuni]
ELFLKYIKIYNKIHSAKIRIQNQLSYKLGQALIQANKNWYGGGYIKLLLEIRKLKREYNKKEAYE